MRPILLLLLLMGGDLCSGCSRTGASKERKVQAINVLKQRGASVQIAERSTSVSFDGTEVDDDVVAGIVVELSVLQPIEMLDLRNSRVTGRSLAALSGLNVNRLVLDPEQVTIQSIRQLNSCHSIQFIQLTGAGVTDDVIVGLVPALKEWKLPGGRGGKLMLDAIKPETLKQLESEVPTLRGIQTNWGWHPIAEAWNGPR